MSDAAPLWASFQSLFQLSVAVNLGYVALIAFFGNTFEWERRQLERLTQSSKIIFDEHVRRGMDTIQPLNNLTTALNLQSELSGCEKRASFWFFVVMRIVSAVLALIALALLVASSYYANENISVFPHYLSWMLMVPVVLFAFGSTVFSIKVSWRLGVRRQKIETSVRQSILELTTAVEPQAAVESQA